MNKNMIEVWNRVSKNFGKVGPKYWDYFGQRLVEVSNIKEGSKILDIGCGGGASLFPAAKKANSLGHAIGIDISSGMVNECLQRGKELNINNFDAKNMDANKLEFDDSSFDFVLNGFGFPYLYKNDNNFSEIKRVLNEKGSLCMVTWDDQEDDSWMMTLVNKYLQKKKKADNKKDSIKNEKPLSLTSREDIIIILEKAGFKDVQIITEDKYFTYKDKEEWWLEMWANAVRSILEKLEKQGGECLQNFKEDAFIELERYKTDEGYTFKRSVFYVIGQR